MFKINLQLFGGRGGSSGGTNQTSSRSAQTFQIQQQPPQIQFTAQAAQQANKSAFSDTDNAPFHDLYNGAQYFQKQNLTADQITATIQYLRSDKEVLNGVPTQYSMSQNMNWIMTQNAEKGLPIDHGMNANQRFTLRHMLASMHNLGYNINLTRYDHGDFVNRILQKMGIKQDFTTMTQNQLSKALVGTKYNEEKLISTSYNDLRHAPQQTKDTFLNRAVRIEYKARASTQAMMPGNGPGGASGEIVLAPSGGQKNFSIVGVRYDTTRRVRQKSTSWLSNQRQLVITVEVG